MQQNDRTLARRLRTPVHGYPRLGREPQKLGVCVAATCAAGESSVILLHPPLPLVGVSIAMGRERQPNDSLVNGYVLS